MLFADSDIEKPFWIDFPWLGWRVKLPRYTIKFCATEPRGKEGPAKAKENVDVAQTKRGKKKE